jgi:hypothetical protein
VVSAHTLEQDDLLWSAFMNRIADDAPDLQMIMFVDEAARNQRSSQQSKRWALLGKRCVQRRFFVCDERYSILPILTLDGIITYDIIPGSVTSECFLQFLHELVVSWAHGEPYFEWSLINVFSLDSSNQSISWSSQCSRP